MALQESYFNQQVDSSAVAPSDGEIQSETVTVCRTAVADASGGGSTWATP